MNTQIDLPELKWLTEFEQTAGDVVDHFIGRVLPGFIDAYYLGGNKGLLRQLRESARRRRCNPTTTTVAPSGTAVRIAKNVLGRCPVEIRTELPLGEDGVKAELVHALASEGARDRPVITLYAASFLEQGLTGDALLEELYWTVFEQYVRYFELHLARPTHAAPASTRPPLPPPVMRA